MGLVKSLMQNSYREETYRIYIGREISIFICLSSFRLIPLHLRYTLRRLKVSK